MKTRIIATLLGLFLLTACGQLEGNILTFKTADPGVSFAFFLPPLPGDMIIPDEEVGDVLPDPTPVPPCLIVKGNISSSGEKIFHIPGGASYEQVKIEESKGEAFFCSEEEAVAAGFRKALR